MLKLSSLNAFFQMKEKSTFARYMAHLKSLAVLTFF
jgi:hypothetical protein